MSMWRVTPCFEIILSTAHSAGPFGILKENNYAGFVDTQKGTFSNNVVVWHEGDIHTMVNIDPNTLPQTFTFKANRWHNETAPGNSVPTLATEETQCLYGINPQLDGNGVIPWSFDWGLWLVNTDQDGDSFALPDDQSFQLATPTSTNTLLDKGQANPLIGGGLIALWTSPSISLAAFSQALLLSSGSSSIPPRAPEFIHNQGQRTYDRLDSLAFRFGKDISAILDATDLTLANSTTGIAVDLSSSTLNWSSTDSVAIWDVSQSGLTEGNYEATLKDGSIGDAPKNHLGDKDDGTSGRSHTRAVIVAWGGRGSRSGRRLRRLRGVSRKSPCGCE